ncbi:MAG: MFS transporter [Firmicutes bacterium]|nr:MFS transporter [Bacillota bacterium]
MAIFWRYPGFRWLWLGQLLSQLGNAIFSILALWEIQLKAPFLLSVAGLAMTVPSFLSIVGGAIVDRYDPRKVMLTTDILRGLAVLGGLVAVGRPGWLVGIMISLLGINALGGAVFSPAELVLVPRLVSPPDLTAANGWYSTTTQIASAVGSAVGGAAVVGLGIRVVFGLDMGSFWISAVTILFVMRLVAAIRQPWDQGDSPSDGSGFWTRLQEGMRMFRQLPVLARLLPAIVLGNFAFMAAFTMMPYWIHHHLHADALWYGLVDAGWSAGMMAGSVGAGLFRRWRLQPAMMGLSLAVGMLTLGFALSPWPLLSTCLVVGAGAANGVINAVMMTLLQRLVPDAVKGRVFGIIMTLFGLANPLGSLAAGVFLHVLPLAWSWFLAAASVTVLALNMWRMKDEFQALDQRHAAMQSR